MYQGKLVFAQLKDHLPRSVFDRCVSRYVGSHAPLKLSHWDQLLCMMFAQLTAREGLRDITECLRSHSSKLYHAGFKGEVKRATLADANEIRDCRIFEEFALHLIGVARQLWVNESLAFELKHTAYAIDASTIDLCLSLFAWAPAANERAGVKLHTLLDLRGNIPAFIRITGARIPDASFLDHLRVEAGSFYVMDRGYVHFARLIKFVHARAFFVIRSLSKMHYRVVSSSSVQEGSHIISDEHIALTGRYTKVDYPDVLRRIDFFDVQRGRHLIFLTNNFELDAVKIALLYKSRWRVELFFKWIKQNLRIKAFVGNSANAVKTQIWCAICTYVIVAIIKKRLALKASMHTIVQVLSLSLFERKDIAQLLVSVVEDTDNLDPPEQISLFENISGQ